MEKIIDVSALTDQLKILLWDRSKTREELAELVIGLIEETGEEIVQCKDCKCFDPCEEVIGVSWTGFCNYGGFHTDEDDFCSRWKRRDNDD